MFHKRFKGMSASSGGLISADVPVGLAELSERGYLGRRTQTAKKEHRVSVTLSNAKLKAGGITVPTLPT